MICKSVIRRLLIYRPPTWQSAVLRRLSSSRCTRYDSSSQIGVCRWPTWRVSCDSTWPQSAPNLHSTPIRNWKPNSTCRM